MRFWVLFLFMIIFSPLTSVSAEAPIKAVFIRDQQLWLVEGEQESQLTKGRNVSSPKWSYDGRFIAYLDRDDQTYLFVYDTKEKMSYQPYETIQTRDFQWSPVSNQLAYNAGGVLNVTRTKNSRPEGFQNVSLGTGDFVWLPDGKGFIISSQASLRPTGWGPIHLYKVPIDANLDGSKVKPFYTIETNETDLFAINAAYFKWSPDYNWLSFIAIPTASWSADSNTLCVLSKEAAKFQAVGKMLNNADWFKWSPSETKLAYISGEGRFYVEDKKATIADIPISHQQREYTPNGFVDLGIDWFSKDEIIVARAKENKQWDEGPVPIMYTSLYAIDLKTNKQTQITFPKKGEMDRSPQVIGSNITWYRNTTNQDIGDVWIQHGLMGKSKIWLENVAGDPVFFHKK
ncbi:Tol biopolymer transport system component [Bacillus mesophilus]|uniref:Translocation protein TolB n=1 Tax=Bacillus mesophilus TaxID=1808955 RepID=A0A6M0QAF0_9BACI|nr:translocation protein TolB [Bacillus mesophilus]MBM7662701.1 Tol biopolymer transport system component [Bacillus mesophilus]NEY73237.1 translocation protein TolB [Bacillus mesophilus]